MRRHVSRHLPRRWRRNLSVSAHSDVFRASLLLVSDASVSHARHMQWAWRSCDVLTLTCNPTPQGERGVAVGCLRPIADSSSSELLEQHHVERGETLRAKEMLRTKACCSGVQRNLVGALRSCSVFNIRIFTR
jgi:hypothetical protein